MRLKKFEGWGSGLDYVIFLSEAIGGGGGLGLDYGAEVVRKPKKLIM